MKNKLNILFITCNNNDFACNRRIVRRLAHKNFKQIVILDNIKYDKSILTAEHTLCFIFYQYSLTISIERQL